MSCCYVPGQVVVVPKPSAPLSGMEILHRPDQWLAKNEVRANWPDLPAPTILRVPVGQERRSAENLSQRPDIIGALPNFFVEPSQAGFCDGLAQINEARVAAAISEIAAPWWNSVPQSVSVAVIDTGYHGNGVAVTLNACDPLDTQTPGSALHGTLVSELILRTAGAVATVTSSRAYGNSRTIAAVLLAVHLAEAYSAPDIFNLSLSLPEEFGSCINCGYADRGDFTAAQLGRMIGGVATRRDRLSSPIWIAAAGNLQNYRRGQGPRQDLQVKLPASLENVIAVGAYDSLSGTVPGYSFYRSVPAHRFVSTWGGDDSDEDCVAKAPTSIYQNRLFGTSFAAPLVTGAVAQYLAYRKHAGAVGEPLQELLGWLAWTSRPVADADGRQRGLGVLQGHPPELCDGITVRGLLQRTLFSSPREATEFNSAKLPLESFRPGNTELPNEALDRLRAEAYSLWSADGRPQGDGVNYWLAARKNLNLPSWLG